MKGRNKLEDERIPRREFLKQLGLVGATLTLGPGTVLLNGCVDYPYFDYESSRIAKGIDKVAPLTEEITKDAESIEDAILSIIQWTQKNFFHFYENERKGEIYGFGVYGADDVRDYVYGILPNLPIEDVFRERAVGCHSITAIQVTMLRSIGILANYTDIIEKHKGQKGIHGVLYLKELDKFAHGDLVSTLPTTPAEKLVQPWEEIFHFTRMPEEEYRIYKDELRKQMYTRLQRHGNNLYIEGYLKSSGNEEDFYQMSTLVPEYELELHPINVTDLRLITSREVPIRELV